MPGDITRGVASYPEFLRRGEGRCAERGYRDDFTQTGSRKANVEARERAKAICRACKFRVQCLAWAIETEQEGVYGATDTEERRKYGDEIRTGGGARSTVAGAYRGTDQGGRAA